MRMHSLLTASTLLLATVTAAGADDFAKLRSASILPKDPVKVSGVVPRMGEHWANPKDLPLGPIYCVIQRRIVCAEFMIAQEDFEAGRSFPVLEAPLRKERRLPPRDYLDVGFQAHGHAGT